MLGLARNDAAGTSLLLNLEGLATIVNRLRMLTPIGADLTPVADCVAARNQKPSSNDPAPIGGSLFEAVSQQSLLDKPDSRSPLLR